MEASRRGLHYKAAPLRTAPRPATTDGAVNTGTTTASFTGGKTTRVSGTTAHSANAPVKIGVTFLILFGG
jgi:hypothetical protein